MRRTDRAVTEFSEIVAIMQRCDVCRLALHDGEYPYILPLNFGMQVDGDAITLYFHGATSGKKYDLIEKNNHAGFEMDCSHQLVVPANAESCACGMKYESVIGHGIVSIVPDEMKYDALCALMHQYNQMECRFNPEMLKRTTVFQLKVLSCTGKHRI